MTNRRVFLRDGGLALVSLGFAPSFLARTAAASTARQKLLIAIFQRGAVDGLNMVVPYGERAYYKNRPNIAVPRPGGADAALDLDGFFAFHPRLAPLKADLRSPRAGGDPRVWVAGSHAGRTSTRRTTWSRARPASRAPTRAG
jgi:uncharacterized protein (DUF1501 family)